MGGSNSPPLTAPASGEVQVQPSPKTEPPRLLESPLREAHDNQGGSSSLAPRPPKGRVTAVCSRRDQGRVPSARASDPKSRSKGQRGSAHSPSVPSRCSAVTPLRSLTWWLVLLGISHTVSDPPTCPLARTCWCQGCLRVSPLLPCSLWSRTRNRIHRDCCLDRRQDSHDGSEVSA